MSGCNVSCCEGDTVWYIPLHSIAVYRLSECKRKCSPFTFTLCINSNIQRSAERQTFGLRWRTTIFMALFFPFHFELTVFFCVAFPFGFRLLSIIEDGIRLRLSLPCIDAANVVNFSSISCDCVGVGVCACVCDRIGCYWKGTWLMFCQAAVATSWDNDSEKSRLLALFIECWIN